MTQSETDLGGNSCGRADWTNLLAAVALLLLGGCAEKPREGDGAPPDVQRVTSTRASALEVAAPPTSTDAHGKHASVGFRCETCHACGLFQLDGSIRFPGGTTTSGGQMFLGSPTTCSVGCHNPFNAAARSVAWSTPGPLACTNCHALPAPPAGSTRSSHLGGLVDPETPAPCKSCHLTTRHLSGTIALVTQGEDPNARCTDCHDGSGWVVAGRTPPLLVGFSDPAGDWHGARAGTGWGGTLAPPYERSQPPLPCSSCHDAHASGNAFLLASTINGASVPQGRIDRTGVGAEAVCAACHVGARHAGCATNECHRKDGVPVDPAPAGRPCFYCHGHEGTLEWPSCHGCHNASLPAPEYRAPVITHVPGASGVPGDPEAPAWIKVTDVGVTSATIRWGTDEISTSYVEYGEGGPARVSGTRALVADHQVTLTGLSEHTTYVFRVRSSDRMRNVLRSPLLEFTTAWVQGPRAPALVIQTSSGLTTTFQWSAVTDPDGDPVQYRVQVDDSPTFASPDVDSGWIGSTSFTAMLTEGRQHSRVMARDAAHDLWSPWSSTGAFFVAEPSWEE